MGVEREIAPNLSVSARYVHKQLDRALEDIGTLDAQQNELYTVGNPGFGWAATFYPVGRDEPIPLAEGEARLRRGRDRPRPAPVRPLVGPRVVHVEPALRQLLGPRPVRRGRAAQPEHRPQLRLPADVVRRERPAGLRCPGHGPAAPAEGPRPLRLRLRDERRGELVRRQRHPEDARGRVHSRQRLPGDVPRPQQRRPPAVLQPARPLRPAPVPVRLEGATDPERERDQPAEPGDRDQLLPDRALHRAGGAGRRRRTSTRASTRRPSSPSRSSSATRGS